MDHHWDCSWLQKPSTEKNMGPNTWPKVCFDSWQLSDISSFLRTHLVSLHQKKVPRATVHYLPEVTIRTILHTQVEFVRKYCAPKSRGFTVNHLIILTRSVNHLIFLTPAQNLRATHSKTPFFFRNTPTFPEIPPLSTEPSKAKLPSARGANLWPFRIVQFGSTLIGAIPRFGLEETWTNTHIFLFFFLLVHISGILLDHPINFPKISVKHGKWNPIKSH